MDIRSAIDTLTPPWKKLLSKELHAPYFHKLQDFLKSVDGVCYPDPDDVFAVYKILNPKDIKVVILGQDPYHDVGQAHGLAFSVKDVQKLPPSLVNIFKELADDLKTPLRSNGNLTSWAKQGVFLLNSVLTVTAHSPHSHKGKGWEKFTDATIRSISENNEHVVFILWGASAQKKSSLIDSSKHTILTSAHPSPLSVYRGFWKSKPFSKTNDSLKNHHQTSIDWNK